MNILFTILSAPFVSLLPEIAYAQLGTLDPLISTVGNNAGLSTTLGGGGGINCIGAAGTGACAIANMFVYAVIRVRLLVAPLAAVIIAVAGFRLIIGQADESLATARRTIVGAITGIFLIFLAEPFIDAIYGGFTITAGEITSQIDARAMIFTNELLGLLEWGKVLVAVVAAGLLIYQAVMTLGSFGSEEMIKRTYKAALYTVVGLLIIGFDYAIAAVFGYTTIGDMPGPPAATTFLTELFGLVGFFLALIAIIVIGVIVYSGLMMIANFGNEEMLTKGKTALLNAVIGLILIAVSYTIVSTVILGL